MDARLVIAEVIVAALVWLSVREELSSRSSGAGSATLKRRTRNGVDESEFSNPTGHARMAADGDSSLTPGINPWTLLNASLLSLVFWVPVLWFAFK